MKLVEIVSTSETSAGVTQALFDLCHKLGKTPVGCKDTPGFIVRLERWRLRG
jgi:3-hydroxyacyl-CoA dehydrogenase